MGNKLEKFKEWLNEQNNIVRVIAVDEFIEICNMVGEISVSENINERGYPKTMNVNAYNGKVNIGGWYINDITRIKDNWVISVDGYHEYIITSV